MGGITGCLYNPYIDNESEPRRGLGELFKIVRWTKNGKYREISTCLVVLACDWIMCRGVKEVKYTRVTQNLKRMTRRNRTIKHSNQQGP